LHIKSLNLISCRPSRAVVLSREDGEGSQNAQLEILRFAQDDVIVCRQQRLKVQALSAVTLGELQAGVEITRERDQEKASEIEHWIDQVAQTWNILPVDARVFRVCAKLMHRRPDHLFEDALIAATAIVHHLVVVTRNVRHFTPFQVDTLDPFATK